MQAIARIALTVAFLAGAAIAQTVWTVGPGRDFAEIQPAVDAAREGDVVLVEDAPFPGYESFIVDGKSLTILGDGSGAVLDNFAGASVRNLAAEQRVVVRNLYFRGGMSVHDNDGVVWVEECGFTYPDLAGDPFDSSITVQSSAALVMSRCDSISIHGTDSGLFLFETSYIGVSGFDHGGDGASIASGTLFASGCSFIHGIEAGCGFHEPPCLDGTGFVLSGSAQAWTLDCTFTTTSIDPSAQWTQLPGTSRALDVPSPRREGDLVLLRFAGVPTDHLELLISSGLELVFVPPVVPGGTVGPVLPRDPILRVIDLGLLGPAKNQLDKIHTILPLQPGLQALTLFLQPRMTATDGTVYLGAPSAFTILDESL